MPMRTPLTIISGPLGSGKTTLLRHLLATVSRKLAIIMNEFGEIAVDSKIIEGKSVRMAELAGGCVCCSLLGEFEAAVNEIIATVAPEDIILETTGVAEPGALVFDIEENLPQIRLDGVICVEDADGLLKYPSLGHTARVQIESADLLLLNKVDLVSESALPPLEAKLRQLNDTASILRVERGRVDAALLLGLGREKAVPKPAHVHQLEFESFSYASGATFNRERFEAFAASLAPAIYRAKGFIQFPDGPQLFNYVAGRWDFEPFAHEGTELVFIGKQVTPHREAILHRLQACETPHATRTTHHAP
jgi:G3E family GTPase